jgi:hypothetical protein
MDRPTLQHIAVTLLARHPGRRAVATRGETVQLINVMRTHLR